MGMQSLHLTVSEVAVIHGVSADRVDTYARERRMKRCRFTPGDPRSRDDLGAVWQGKGPDAQAPRRRNTSRAVSLAVRRGLAALIHRAAAVRS